MENTFNEWALVELFGHNKIAGKVSEFKMGNDSMIRVDVPEIDEKHPAFTKIYSPKAVYGITPLSEQSAMGFVRSFKVKPIDIYDMQRVFESEIEKLVAKGSLMKPQLAEPDDDFIM